MIGIDALRYFWNRYFWKAKQPQKVAGDRARTIDTQSQGIEDLKRRVDRLFLQC